MIHSANQHNHDGHDNKVDQLTPLEAAHKAAVGLYKAGAITKKEMREYDRLCLSDDVTNK